MEAVSERMQKYTYDYEELPDLDKEEYREFRFHFQQSILLSLLIEKKLTRQQYDACLEKLSYKYYKNEVPFGHAIASKQDDRVKYE